MPHKRRAKLLFFFERRKHSWAFMLHNIFLGKSQGEDVNSLVIAD